MTMFDYMSYELSHTREMNHGDRFWALLNSMTGGKAFELREELKKYKPMLKSFLIYLYYRLLKSTYFISINYAFNYVLNG